MPVSYDKAKERWRFYFRRRINGQPVQLTKLLPQGWSRNQAEAYDRKESGRLYAQATGLEKPRLPLAGAVQLYLDHRCPELVNGKKVAQDLAHLIDLIESSYLDQVADVSERYIARNPHLSAGTLHNRLAYLKAAVRYARKRHRYGRDLPDYAADMTIPVPKNQRQEYAKLSQLTKLWKHLATDEARALFKMTFYMGLRWRAELLTRKPEDVIRNGKDRWLNIGTTKNGMPVMKPVHPAVLDCLKFIPFKYDDNHYYRQWRAARLEVKMPNLNPHDLRHSLASEVLSRPGGTLDDVRAALHQKSRQSADRYAHLYPERMREIMMGVGKIAHQTKRIPAKKRVADAR